MKKILVGVLTTLGVLLAYIAVGQAADGPHEYAANVSVEQVTAVIKQLDEYDAEVDMLAKLLYAECRGIASEAEKAAVVWCVLNRVDADGWGDTISDVVTAKNQFAYSRRTKIDDGLHDLARDVIVRWLLEKQGVEDVGRVLPKEYTYFAGRGGHNWFRSAYRSKDYWDWSLPNPHEANTDER